MTRRHAWSRIPLVFGLIFICLAQAPNRKTGNVIFVMTDGLRWQEVFTGADPALLPPTSELRRDFWRDTASQRREALCPFLWTVVAKNGQIYGNRETGSQAYVTNGFNFSYPGYNEALSGHPDPRINSNDKKPNPNVTVLEWLNRKAAYKGRVAAFAAWDVFPFILNRDRSGLMVNAGYEALRLSPSTPTLDIMNQLKQETRVWDEEPLDALTFHSALEYFKLRKPRVLYLSLGETDDWAHEGKYELYLRAAHRFDQYVKELWETAQRMEGYRGQTSLILAVDHGRGLAPTDWKSHGQKLPESKNVWMAFLGPDTRPLGERATGDVTQSQLAATLAALLGENYNADAPEAGQPVRDAMQSGAGSVQRAPLSH